MKITAEEFAYIDAAYQMTRKAALVGIPEQWKLHIGNWWTFWSLSLEHEFGTNVIGLITEEEAAAVRALFEATIPIYDPALLLDATNAIASVMYQAIEADFFPDGDPKIPERIPLHDATHVYEGGRWKRVDGPWRDDSHALVAMLKDAEELYKANGTIPSLRVFGKLRSGGSPCIMGGGDSDSKSYNVHWHGTPMEFEIVGENEEASSMCLYFRTRLNNGVYTGGIKRVRVQGMKLSSSDWNDQRAIGAPKGHFHQLPDGTWGALEVYDCEIVGNPNVYPYQGLKWGVRASARMAWDFRNLSCSTPIQEHLLYLDSPQPGPSGFAFIADQVRMLAASSRTHTQIVNRSVDNPGPSGNGILMWNQCEHRAHYDESGEGGGGAFTVAGHLGPIYNIDCSVRTRLSAMAIWRDSGKDKGVYEDADGFVNGPVVVRRPKFSIYGGETQTNDRDLLQVSSARSVLIEDWALQSARACMDLHGSDREPASSRNGSVRLVRTDGRPNSKAGWDLRGSGARKVDWGPDGETLSDDEIDALGE